MRFSADLSSAGNRPEPTIIEESVPYRQLTREVLPVADWRDVWLTVAGMLILFICANLAVGWYLDRYPSNRGYWLIERKWELLDSLTEPADWLILGDSSCNQGIEPRLFGELVGGTAVNLCTIGNMGILGDAWMLDAYINKFGPPKNVLIVHVHDIWQRQLRPVAVAQIPDIETRWTDFNFFPDLDSHHIHRFLLARYLPLYAESSTLRQKLLSPLEAFAPNSFEVSPRGFMAWEQAHPDRVRQIAERFAEQVDTFKVSSVNQQTFDYIETLAQQLGFNVILAQSPQPSVMYRDPRLRDYYRSVNQVLKKMIAGEDKISYLPDFILFPASQMENTNHVTTQGAFDYTRQLAAQVLKKVDHLR